MNTYQKFIIAVFLIFFILPIVVIAAPYDLSRVDAPKKIQKLIKEDILNWINNKIIVDAINKANKTHAKRTSVQIKKADKKWRAAKGINNTMKKYLSSKAAKYLKDVQKRSKGVYSEIFIMDYQGCNVAMSDKTSDFWQGDELKFVRAYKDGNGSIFVDKIHYDESTRTYSIQVSLPVIDPKTKKVIGVITIGIDMSKL